MWLRSTHLFTSQFVPRIITDISEIKTPTTSPRIKGDTVADVQSNTPDDVTSLDQQVTALRNMRSRPSRLVLSKPTRDTSSWLERSSSRKRLMTLRERESVRISCSQRTVSINQNLPDMYPSLLRPLWSIWTWRIRVTIRPSTSKTIPFCFRVQR